MKSKNFQRDRAQAAALLEWARQSEQAAAAISVECNIQREQAALQEAWDELQAVPSYVEREANQKAEVYNDIQSK